jgi:hypothetical protein
VGKIKGKKGKGFLEIRRLIREDNIKKVLQEIG